MFIEECVNKAGVKKAFPLPIHSTMYTYLIIGRLSLYIAFLLLSTFLPSSHNLMNLQVSSQASQRSWPYWSFLCPNFCIIAPTELHYLLTSSENFSLPPSPYPKFLEGRNYILNVFDSTAYYCLAHIKY